MKRIILVAFMIMFGVGLIACQTAKEDRADTPSPRQTSGEEGKVSQGALEGEDLSDVPEGQAFSMAEEYLKSMSLEEKVGQMFVVNLTSLAKKRTLDGNIYRKTKEIDSKLKKYKIGGVYLTENNIGKEEQARKLVADLQASVSGGAMYVAVEEEGGGTHSLSARVDDLSHTGYTTQSEMGENMTEQQVYEAGRTIASGLTNVGVNLNLAPVADIAGENNPEYVPRCFSSDVDVVAEMTDSIVRGMRENGLAVTLKTFPGVGNVPGDFSETIAVTDESLMTMRNVNFLPYSAGIEAGADCVMVGSVALNKVTGDKTPAFMSGDIVTSLLREELGFHGVVFTPPMDENVIKNNFTTEFAVREAVKAGCDIILLPADFESAYYSLLKDVRSGEIQEKVINAAVLRILQNKIQRGILKIQ